MKKYARLAIVAVGLLAMSGCTNLDDLQQKMLSGGATGAVVGTVTIAATGGCIPCGTAVGGAVGTAAGYLLDQLDKETKSSPSDSSSSSSSSSYSSNKYAGSGYSSVSGR